MRRQAARNEETKGKIKCGAKISDYLFSPCAVSFSGISVSVSYYRGCE